MSKVENRQIEFAVAVFEPRLAKLSLARLMKYTLRSCRAITALLVLVLAISYSGTTNAAAKPLQTPVASYPLQCDETFSCPQSLLPRVSFWVEVFSRWDTNTAIFHDSENPERVYSIVSRKEGCRRSRKGDSIDRERKRLSKTLKDLASRQSGGKSLTKSQQQLQTLFAGVASSEISAAASRVRCQSGNRDRMQEALKQFQLYRPYILDALESQNLTAELQYLPFVESAFNPEALSHLGAAGLWQIMPRTGRSLGLTVNSVVDERYDPRRATTAAAQYFRESVDRLTTTAFENGYSVQAKDLNPFVITSYNYGVRGMQRAVKQVGLNYERLLLEYKSPNFQTAVKNFYASFLAARHVAKNAEQFFGVLQADHQGQIYSYNTETLGRATSAKRLSKALNIDKDTLDKLNPALKKIVWRDKALIPKGFKLNLPYQEAGWQAALAKVGQLPAEYAKPGFEWHKVRSGQTACGIADKYRASCRQLFRLNSLNKRGTIYAGQRIKVPTNNGGIGIRLSASKPRAGEAVSASTTAYRVRSGDTACAIARRHKMRCAELLALNGLQASSVIRVGQRLIVSGANDWHTVSRGQTPCGIADRYRIKCGDLLDANRLSRRSTIYVGQRLRIPTRS